MSNLRVVVVVGAGPGLGGAVARRFAREGYAVALFARKLEPLAAIRAAIIDAGGRAEAFAVDAGDTASMAKGFADVRATLGDPEVLVYNAAAFVMGRVVDLEPSQVEQAWRANCLGGLIAAREVLKSMLAQHKGTLIFTGATASIRGSAKFAGFAIGKFGLRALAQSLAREVGPEGVHVAHVIIDGAIDTPRLRASNPSRAKDTALDPDAIAESYWAIHTQPVSAWTFEMDLRPSTEMF